MKNKSLNLKILLVWLLLFCISKLYAHTNSIGYVSEGVGSATFWYGNWHPGTNFSEGSISLVGISAGLTYNQTKAYNLLSPTLPTGLLASGVPINYYNSNGSALIPYKGSIIAPYTTLTACGNAGASNCTSSTWQGATFLGLTA